MKKLVVSLAVACVAAYGVYYVANKKVEDELRASLVKSYKETSGTEFKGDVSTNVLFGTLDIKNFTFGEGDQRSGDIKFEGIQYYNKDRLLGDNLKISLNNYTVKEGNMVYKSDNQLSVKNLGEGKVLVDWVSKTHEDNTTNKLNQHLVLNIDNIGNTYDNLNGELTRSILDPKYEPDPVKIGRDILSARILDAKLVMNNEGLVKKGMINGVKTQYPEQSEADIEKYLKLDGENFLKSTFTDDQTKAILKFFNDEQGKLVVQIKNTQNSTIAETYGALLMTANPAYALSKNYQLTITN